MIKAYLIGDKIVSNSTEAFGAYEKSRYGEKKNGRIEYADVEAFYLVSGKKMSVFSGSKEISEELLFRKLRKKDGRIEVKLGVFGDLRRKGYVVKTALKFGAEFRVYERGIKPGEDHARWLVYCVKENEAMRWHELAAKSRVAHSTKKSLLLGIVDEEGDVTYYEAAWVKI